MIYEWENGKETIEGRHCFCKSIKREKRTSGRLSKKNPFILSSISCY